MDQPLRCNEVIQQWHRRIAEFVVPLTPLFTEIYIQDTADPDRPSERIWWKRSDISSLSHDQQASLSERPGCLGLTHYATYQGRRGELRTLEALWQHRTNTDAIAAVLISASLFSRLNARDYPEGWPPYAIVESLRNMIDENWEGQVGCWDSANTVVLPSVNRDFDYSINRPHALIRYLAEEHAALLHQFAPVNVCYF